MAITSRQVLAIVSIALLLIPLALAAASLHLTNTYALPIPTSLNAFAIALPPLAALVLHRANRELRRPDRPFALNTMSPATWLATLSLLVLETVLATLAGSLLSAQEAANCRLTTHWQTLYRHKDARSLRRVQDLLDCCGLHSVRDMPWPFPRGSIGPETCEARFGRRKSCFADWRGVEVKGVGMLLASVLLVGLWMFAMLLVIHRFGNEKHVWLPENAAAVTYTDEEDDPVSDASRRAARYQPAGSITVRDNLITEAEDESGWREEQGSSSDGVINGKIALTSGMRLPALQE